jgi:hypothetical protein
VVRLRGIVRQGLIHDWRRGQVPLNEPETEEIVRDRGKIRGDLKKR